MSDDESTDDEDFEFDADQGTMKRYPLHDCCEHDDADALRNLIYITSEVIDKEDDSPTDQKCNDETKQSYHDSSSDENDSTAAAHAAAVGHSPQGIKPGAVLDVSLVPLSIPQDHLIAKVVHNKDSLEQIKDTLGVVNDPSTASDRNLAADDSIANTALEPTPSDTNKHAEAQPLLTRLNDEPLANGLSFKNVEDACASILDGNQGTEEDMRIPNSSQEICSHKKANKLEVDPEINLNERDEDENSALHVAIHSRKLEHVKILLEAGASFRMRCDGSLPIHTAISIGSLAAHRQFAYECVVLLHEHGADLSVKDDAVQTPLFLACKSNLVQVVSYILSDEDGVSTLNIRADRAGNRPLHAAAKYDTLDNPSLSKPPTLFPPDLSRVNPLTHVDNSVVNATQNLSGSAHKQCPAPLSSATGEESAHTHSTEALLTQVLLGTNGIEVDAVNVLGQTPLHVACMRRNWPVVRLLLHAGACTTIKDRRGFTPGQLAYKRGMPIPNALLELLGEPPKTGITAPVRELIVDPDGSTMLLCHELCMQHQTCPPIDRDSTEPPPENVRRLHVLVNPETGILRTGEFGSLVWKGEARRAAIADVLKVHDYTYVERVSLIASQIPDHPNAIAHLDGDTAISRWSFEAAMRAAGSICEAVDQVVAGDNIRNAFCAIRPPGHHAGPRGIVSCANDPEGGSHGFCLLNNVCIGAAYARSVYRNEGIHKVAIIDFDVHHGNGTEAIIRNLVPNIEKAMIRTPFAVGEMSNSSFRPWLDETDVENVFFSSTHGYGIRGFDQPGWFYPASGKTYTSEAILNPAMVEKPSTADFILSQTWARMGDDSKANCCKIINIGLELPEAETEGDKQSRSMRQRLELRDAYRKKIFPALQDFDPDLIFISAGFDAHRADTMNFGYVGMVEDDYEWVTEQLVKIANTCCNGRVISVLEGGYKIHGGIVSPFARSVASHVRALVDGGRSRELYDTADGKWEALFEHNLYERRERKKEQERDQLRLIEEANRRQRMEEWAGEGDTPEDPDAPSRKRRRNQVNYKELFKQMQQEGFVG